MSETDNTITAPEAAVPPLPKWTEEERELWLDLMQAYSQCLMPSDEDGILRGAAREQRCVEAVRLGAKLADLAVQELSFREFVQAEVITTNTGTRRAFEDFTNWIDRVRPIRKTKKRKSHSHPSYKRRTK